MMATKDPNQDANAQGDEEGPHLGGELVSPDDLGPDDLLPSDHQQGPRELLVNTGLLEGESRSGRGSDDSGVDGV